MKCIGALHGFFIWIILCLAIWMFVPSSLAFVHQNAWWVMGLALTGWWMYGMMLARCDQ